MSGSGKMVGGQLALRDAKMAVFSIPDALNIIKMAQETAGMTTLTIWPHYAQQVNAEVLNYCRKIGVKPILWYPVLADNDIVPDQDETIVQAWDKHGKSITVHD